MSSRATWFLKFAFPVIWTALMALGALPMLANNVRGHGARLPAALTLAAVWLLGSSFIFVFSGSLMRVRFRDGRLYVSNFRREIEIRPDDITAITQNTWVNVRPITIHLRSGTELGRKIRFVPPSRVIFRFWVEDPIVSELRAFAGGAPAAS